MSASLAKQLDRLALEHGFARVTPDSLRDFAASGDSVLLLTAEAAQCPEAWDMAMVLPEALAVVGGRFLAGVAEPFHSQQLASSHGIEVLPALIFQRDGQWVGKLEGMVDWMQLVRTLMEMLQSPTRRRPGLGIPVRVVTVG